MAISIILTFVCYTDIRCRKITNATTLLIFSLSLLLVFHHPEDLSLTLLLLLFCLGFVLSIACIIDTGDVEIVYVLSTGLSTTEMGNFLFLTGIVGIPLSLFTYFLYYRLFSKQNITTIPYGVAICSGYWLLWAV
ncbi:MAG: prepilin peptidase [Symbiopectobacterium sp.]